MNYDQAKKPQAIVALRPSVVSDGIDEPFRSLRDKLVRNVTARTLVAARWVRGQAEFNQVMRFVLAVPLVAGTATPVARDYRPLSAVPAVAERQVALPAPTPSAPVQLATTGTAGTTPVVPPVTSEAVPGPRVRANCSRGTRTVFLDDRPAVEASEDWKEGLTQRYQGAVCSFVPRFGVPEPGFRTYEAPAIEPKPAEPAVAPLTATDPIRVKTSIEREMFDPNVATPAVPTRGPDADGIEQALAVLGAPAAGRAAVGEKVPDNRARAAIAALAAVDGQDLPLPGSAPSKLAATSEKTSPVPMPPRRIAVRLSTNDPRQFPAYLNYRWTSDRVEVLFDTGMTLLEDDLYFPAGRTSNWSAVFNRASERGASEAIQRASADMADLTKTQWLRGASLVVTTVTPSWPTPKVQRVSQSDASGQTETLTQLSSAL
ncbi:hypothetical protein ACVIGB_000121 [Bradyrhizobium sp. USDA 4341]